MRWFKRGRYKYLIVLVGCSFSMWVLLATNQTRTTSADTLLQNIYNDVNLTSIFPTNVSIISMKKPSTDQTHLEQWKSVSEEYVWEDAIHLAGKIRPNPGLLTIGIPTVYRPNASYIHATLTSLINSMSPEERSQVVCVIFLSRFNNTYSEDLVTNLTTYFDEHLESGFIRVITAPETYYPSMDNLKLTFKDSIKRVRWRSRQNLDYAFLVRYSQNISKYYLQIEDDVIARSQLVGKILEFVNKQKKDWVMLDFSGQGFIGKLFKSSDLTKLAMILRVFFNEQPCDFLVNYFSGLLLQTKHIVRKPSLFKHIGHFSSLNHQIRRISLSNNPEAEVNTSIETYKKYTIENAYNGDSKFWGKTPKIGDQVNILFSGVQNSIKRIIIETGEKKEPFADRVKGAVLEYGQGTNRGCTKYFIMDKFTDGRIDFNSTGIKYIRCLRMRVTEEQPSWIVISKIGIIT